MTTPKTAIAQAITVLERTDHATHADRMAAADDLRALLAEQQSAEPAPGRAVYEDGDVFERIAARKKQQAAEPVDKVAIMQRIVDSQTGHTRTVAREPEQEPTCKQHLQVWVIPKGKGRGQFSWEPQDERFWTRMEPAVKQSLTAQPEPTQQVAEPNAILVEDFGRVAMRKLNDLREKGYAINGVSIATIGPDGKTEHGAVTTGGMVLWWPQQPAQQAAESDYSICPACGGMSADPIVPIEARQRDSVACRDEMCACRGGPCASCPDGERKKELSDLRASLDFYKRRADELQKAQSKMRDPERTMVCDILANGTLLVPAGGRYSAPTHQPLTDEQIWEAYMKAPVDIDCHVSDLHKFARAIEAAHGITSKKGGAA